MPRVDVFATEPHYLDHIAPVWHALPADCRGRVITPEHLTEYAQILGMDGHHHDGRTHVIVAGWVDARSVYMWPDVILMEHGVGQAYISDQDGTWASSAYAGGPGRDGITLYLCPNQRVADLNAADQDGRCVIIGDPYLDKLEQGTSLPNVPTVFDAVFSWHWNCEFVPETMSAWNHYRAELVRMRHREDGTPAPTFAGTAHPRAWRDLRRWYKQVDIFSVQSLDLALQLGRVFVADNTSAMFYAAALGHPVVVLDAPWYRHDVEHGLRFWEYADVGINCSHPEVLENAIRSAEHTQRAQEICADLFPFRDGKSALRGAEAICGTF